MCIPLALIACCLVAVYYAYNPDRGADSDEGFTDAPIVIPPQQNQQVEIPTVQATVIPDKDVEQTQMT